MWELPIQLSLWQKAFAQQWDASKSSDDDKTLNAYTGRRTPYKTVNRKIGKLNISNSYKFPTVDHTTVGRLFVPQSRQNR